MFRSLDKQKVVEAVFTGRMLTLTTYGYFSDERDYIDQILNYFLEAAGRAELRDQLAYCVHELANNAKKANTKRVYFQQKGLNIDNESEYWVGMRHFRQETVSNIDFYLQQLKKAGLYIKVQFQLHGRNMRIAIRNNIRLSDIEREKIEEKIARSRRYENMADAYASIEDTSEGAGLGIVMMIIMLRNLGLSERIIRFFSNPDETVVLLTIPTKQSRARARDTETTERAAGV
jgi:hypothetical protein